MKGNLIVWAAAAALFLWAAAATAKDQAGDCSNGGGICGCSYGRLVCCDGSYAPRHYRSAEGRIVYNHCSQPVVHVSPLATHLGEPLPSYEPSHANPSRPLGPSQEIFWKGSVFDR